MVHILEPAHIAPDMGTTLMNETPSIHDIAHTIRQVLSDDFWNIEIVDVRVSRGQDSDGDEILKVDIIFEADEKALDARKVSGVVRHLRPRLSAIGEHGFPLMSFISRTDFAQGKFAPA